MNKNKQVVCPYCGEEMKGGTIQSIGELIWNSGVKKKWLVHQVHQKTRLYFLNLICFLDQHVLHILVENVRK